MTTRRPEPSPRYLTLCVLCMALCVYMRPFVNHTLPFTGIMRGDAVLLLQRRGHRPGETQMANGVQQRPSTLQFLYGHTGFGKCTCGSIFLFKELSICIAPNNPHNIALEPDLGRVRDKIHNRNGAMRSMSVCSVCTIRELICAYARNALCI